MKRRLDKTDRIGFLHPALDVHLLGISAAKELLEECGIRTITADKEVATALERPLEPASARLIGGWIQATGASVLGYSYRLDPEDGLRLFSEFMELLGSLKMLDKDGGRVHSVFFAGLPRTCELVEGKYPEIAGVFRGDETVSETLDLLAIPHGLLESTSSEGVAYDDFRMAFGREIASKGEYNSIRPVDRSGSRLFGKRGDSLSSRVAYGSARGLPPLMRAHMGPYLPDRKQAIELCVDWTRRLAKSGYLDILSLGTSQLSQSAFGEDWEGLPDGGGVPVHSPDEFSRIWEAARPMLVRSYAGTKDVEAMARMLEDRIDIAWHALSLWWFCRIDGRGPNSVVENLQQHLAALSFVAATEKPYEPNVPHQFSFRGGDDLTYVLSGVVAAKAAKAAGIKKLVLQVMLNTPKATWGVCDLAKARALIHLARELEDGDFKIYLQPRGGLDYFSHNPDKAKAQLAAVTALMDDIEPGDASSPQIVHVVSYSEGYSLADPAVIDESIRLTRHSLGEYRRMKEDGELRDREFDNQVLARTSDLLKDARAGIAAIESAIRDPYSATGLYEILASGFFALPYLSECRDEFAEAAKWRTRTIKGATVVVDGDGVPIPTSERITIAKETALRRSAGRRRKG